jgi:hypothetical protein
VNAGPVNGAAEQLLESDQAVPGVEVQAVQPTLVALNNN